MFRGDAGSVMPVAGGWMLGLLLLVFSTGPALADDPIWAGLFRYQQQMAQLGNAEAQFKLAEHYEQGLGVEPDREQARQWYETALQHGYGPAAERLKALEVSSAGNESPAVDPALVQLEREHKARVKAQQELERIRAEQARVEQEMQRQRDEVQRLKAELAREKAAPPAPVAVAPAPAQVAVPPTPAAALSRQQQREAAIAKAEAEYHKVLARRVAQERLEAEMLRLKSTPIGYDN